MKHLFPLVTLLALLGCDSQTIHLNDATAVIYVDGQRAEASAFLSTRELDGTAYQVVTLETTNGERIEIAGLAFEEGQFVKQHAANTSFPFVFSFVDDARPTPYTGMYVARRGSLEIGVARSAVIEGDFEFETANALSSCIECDAATGPKVGGHFKAVRSEM